MSLSSSSHSAVQRVNKAYVEVPLSPLLFSSHRSLNTPVHVVTSSKLKENTPLRSLKQAMSQQSMSLTSYKRKLSDRDSASTVVDGIKPSPAKKSKLFTSVSSNTQPKEKQNVKSAPTSDTSPDFPNGWTYCHQCNKKRDLATTIRCSSVEKVRKAKSNTVKERTCVNKYCKPCLKNRYGEDFEVLKDKNGDMSDFKCPRCMGVCNCPRCRKSQGLEAIGALSKNKDKEQSASTISKASKKSKVEVVISTRVNGKDKSRQKKSAIKAKPKPLPTLKWEPIPVNLTQEQTDERILIREFVLRFSDLFDPSIAKVHLEELECIGGRSQRSNDEGDANVWVSEMCVKAIIIGLLGLLARDYEAEIARLIKICVKDVRSAGASLNKIWSCLVTLRDAINCISASETSEVEAPLTFPDPTPTTFSASNARSLRSITQSNTSVNVAQAAQMIPVILSLIHSALLTTIVREDIDQSMKDSKDYARDAKEALRIENERWEKEREGMDNPNKDKVKILENKAKREMHKTQILHIESCFKVVSKSFLPRFQVLGTDEDGRTYYALSPGIAEREAAFEYLEIMSSTKLQKPKKKGRTLSFEGRQEMREWTWFIAVWGKRPLLTPEELKTKAARRMAVDNSASEAEDDLDVEQWWGFWEPEEIKKVAEYITINSNLDDDPQISEKNGLSTSSKSVITLREKITVSSLPPRMEQLRRLVTELKEYATLLQWRIRDDKCTVVPRFSKAPGENSV